MPDSFQYPVILSMLFLAGGLGIASWTVAKRYLHFFQQEEYTNSRFLSWWFRTRSFEKRANLTAAFFLLTTVLFSGAAVQFLPVVCLAAAAALALAGRSNRENQAKKALVMTSRAKRIFWTAWLMIVAGYPLLLYAFLSSPRPLILTLSLFGLLLLMLALIPLFLVLANLLLAPYETFTQKRYLREAQVLLARHHPAIIGITGSYGKTSAKHILSHILNSHAPTLATPGSVNTKMGITRIVREQLRADHQYFIVEMGAYGIGSIASLCRFTPPKVGMVTAVGIAHLERFGSQETVARAKAELPRALPPDGFAVLNGDNPHCRAMAETLVCPAYFYGADTGQGPLHCRLVSAETVEQGTRCTFEYNDRPQTVVLPVYGRHQAHNAAGAMLLALRLGMPLLSVLAALQTLPQIPHRLVVHRGPDGITTVDDAYNSNPDGFESALAVLQALPVSRRILVTPGMVELGARHEEEHRRLGASAARVCDRVALVAPQRIPSFRSGLLENGFPEENLHAFSTLQDARQWLGNELRTGDAVLFENDLPDLYEVQTAFRLL